MAREKHIVDLTIGNFKRFADFEIKNLGQFNLIVGDNNTGKTSFLEALLFDEESSVFHILSSLDYTIWMRIDNPLNDDDDKENVYQHFDMFLNKTKEDQRLQLTFKALKWEADISLEPFDSEMDLDYLGEFEREKLYSLKKNEIQEFILIINGYVTNSLQIVPDVKEYFPLVPFGKGYAHDLLLFYSEKIDINKQIRNNFIFNLRCLIPNVDDIRIGNNAINIYEEGEENPMPLYSYGEGANKLFRILCEIAMCQGKRLMIDEIDAGIHYSRFKSFWRTIMQAAKAYDVQIFATTHNIECVEYFREVLEEEALQDYQELARIVSLKAKKDNSVKASVYDFEAMQTANKTDYELRGGGL